MKDRPIDIAFLLGKSPKSTTLFPEVFARLEARGLRVRTHLPHEAAEVLPDWAQTAAVVVNRGLKARVLRELEQYERRGLRFCNPVHASLKLNDRVWLLRTLAGAGLSVPHTTLTSDWQEVIAVSEAGSVVVKAADGGPGRGVGVVVPREPLRALPPFPAPYLVQSYVAGDGWDRKLYVAGGRTFGLLKRDTSSKQGSAEAFSPSEPLRALAVRVGEVLGLELYGVDILEGPDGPVIVDVNGFPGFRGVKGAAEAVSEQLASLVGAA